MNALRERVMLVVLSRDAILPDLVTHGIEQSNGLWGGRLEVSLESLIPRARAFAVSQFLRARCPEYERDEAGKVVDVTEHPYDRMVFLDDDIGFKREHFEKLINHDCDIVSGLYAKRTDKHNMWVFLPMDMNRKEVPANGLHEVRGAGTGFLSIRRKVIEKVIKTSNVDVFDYNDIECFDIFPCGVLNKDRHYLSEDYGFCQLAREAGFNVFLDTSIRLKHRGFKWYEGPK